MTRPTQIDTGHLLKTARKMFLSKGYKVSTAEIAHEAGISEGSIFRRFSTKADLFRAAMGFPEFDLEEIIDNLPEKNDIRENLTILLTRLLDFQRQVIPRIIMMWSNPALVPTESMHPLENAPPWKTLKVLKRFLAAQAGAGRLNIKDLDVTARTVMGATHSYAFMEFMEAKAGQKGKEQDFAAQLVELIWEGIAP